MRFAQIRFLYLRMATLLIASLVLVLRAQPCGAQIQVPVVSRFNSGLDGWYSSAPQNISFVSQGGNPGGFVQFNDQTGFDPFIFAPSSFLGDWRYLDGQGVLEFDHKIISLGDNPFSPVHYQVSLTGPGGSPF
jgi:hypothetical protein